MRRIMCADQLSSVVAGLTFVFVSGCGNESVPGGSAQPAAVQAMTHASFRDCDQCREMVAVPAGRFTMGSPATEMQRGLDEEPQRQVTIARPFAVGKFEVTFAEWDVCVREGGCVRV